MTEQILVTLIIFLILYFLLKIYREPFYSSIKQENNIKIHLINTHPIISGQKIRNYLNYQYVNVMLIKTLNDIFKKTNINFNLLKINQYDYRNNLRNKYQHMPLDSNNSFKHITDIQINKFIYNDINIFNKIITFDTPPIYLEKLVTDMCDIGSFDSNIINIIFVPYLKKGIVKINNKIIIGLYKTENDRLTKSIPNIPSNLSYYWINEYYNNVQSRENIKKKIAESKSTCERLKYTPQLNIMTKNININQKFIKNISTIEILAQLLNSSNSAINISKKYDIDLFTSNDNTPKCDIINKYKKVCIKSNNYNYSSKLENDDISSLLKTHLDNPTLDKFKESLTEDLNYFNPTHDKTTEELLENISNINEFIDLDKYNKCDTEDIIESKNRKAYLNSDNYYLNTFPESYI